MADDETGRALRGRKLIDLTDMINQDELEDWTKKFEERLAQAEGRAGHPAAVTEWTPSNRRDVPRMTKLTAAAVEPQRFRAVAFGALTAALPA